MVLAGNINPYQIYFFEIAILFNNLKDLIIESEKCLQSLQYIKLNKTIIFQTHSNEMKMTEFDWGGRWCNIYTCSSIIK